jgi:aminoglycoside 3-N-acetyltransferase
MAPLTKRAIKGWLKRVHGAYVRRCFAFGPEKLQNALTALGVARGDVLLVHSAFDGFQGFTGGPTDVIRVLQDTVGPDGTLLMPTIPFTDSAVAYVSRQPRFDVLRTPSRVGLITEVFRRCPAVVRSVHPTHPVAAWGAKAPEIIAGHHLAQTPCGAGSPYSRLLEHGGRMLFLGTDISSMTFFHAVEELLEPELPFSPFTVERFSVPCRDASGNVVVCTTRLFDPGLSRRRNIIRLVPHLKQRGAWRQASVGRLEMYLLDSLEVLETVRALARAGRYCYDA